MVYTRSADLRLRILILIHDFQNSRFLEPLLKTQELALSEVVIGPSGPSRSTGAVRQMWAAKEMGVVMFASLLHIVKFSLGRQGTFSRSRSSSCLTLIMNFRLRLLKCEYFISRPILGQLLHSILLNGC